MTFVDKKLLKVSFENIEVRKYYKEKYDAGIERAYKENQILEE